MTEVLLKSGPAALGLQVGNQGWTQVVLHLSGEKHILGADSIKIIAKRLADALESPHKLKVCGEIDGTEVRWVLTLFEQHHVIYLAIVNEEIKLYIKEAAVVGTIQLSDSDVANWIDRLHRCLQS